MFKIKRNAEEELEIIHNETLASDDVVLLSLEQSIAEIRKYSITPTTFQVRTFFDNSVILRDLDLDTRSSNNKIVDLKARLVSFNTSIDHSFAELKAVSDGVIGSGEFTKPIKDISDLSVKFTEQIALLEEYTQELQHAIRLIESLRDMPLFFEEIYSNSSDNKVSRFGLNMIGMNDKQISELSAISVPVTKAVSIKSKGSKSSKADQDILPRLHPLEIMLLRKSIADLASNKTVIVDIFARNDDGSIKIEKNIAETHAVVLFKQIDQCQIFVIDPSSFSFSKHVPSNAERILMHDDKNYVITLPEILKGAKIYVSPDKERVGPNPDQYRDCIDIAVKLSEEFNLIDSLEVIMDAIKNITNQPPMMKELFFDSTQAIMRVKQASDDGVRKEVNKLIVKMDQQMKGANEYFRSNEFNNLMEQSNLEILKQSHEPTNYSLAIQNLQHQYAINAKSFIDRINELYEVDILGRGNEDGAC